MTRKQRVSEQYADANLQAATIIASDPAKYPEGSLMQEWADRILSAAAKVEDIGCGPLFKHVA